MSFQNLPTQTVWVIAAICLVAVIAVLIYRAHRKQPAAPQPEQMQEPEPELGISEETCAIVLAAVCEELHTDPRNLRITSIREAEPSAPNA